MLKLPNDPQVYDFKPLGSPIRKESAEKKEEWTKTETPGIEVNSEGKLRTNVPEWESTDWHVQQSSKPATIKWTPELEKEFQEMRRQFKLNVETVCLGARPDAVILDDIQDPTKVWKFQNSDPSPLKVAAQERAGEIIDWDDWSTDIRNYKPSINFDVNK